MFQLSIINNLELHDLKESLPSIICLAFIVTTVVRTTDVLSFSFQLGVVTDSLLLFPIRCVITINELQL